MKISPSIHSHSFIDAQRQIRRRRYSFSSPQILESRADTALQHSAALSKTIPREKFPKICSISSNSNRLFPSNETNPEKYDILSKLNTGAYGSSYLIRDSNDGQIYLLKRVDDSLPNRFRQHLLEERRLLGCLKSDYILALISAYMDTQHHCFSMKFEYVHGLTLLQLLRRFRWFEESVVAFYSAQIVLAFEYFHELNLIYVSIRT